MADAPLSTGGEPEPDLVRASASVAIGTGLSRLTGLVRVGALTYALGTTVVADSYNLANTTPNIIYELLLGGILSATLVPIFVDHRVRRDDDATDALVTVVFAALVAICVAVVAAAPWIVSVYTSRLPADEAERQAEVAVPLLRLFAPQIFFYGATTVGTALLNAKRSFTAPAFAPILNNLVVSAVLLTLPQLADDPITVDSLVSDRGLMLLLGLGTTSGIVTMTLALLPALRRSRSRVRWSWNPRHESVRAVARMSGWTLGYVIANQAALFVILALANGAGEGVVSAYTYGFIFFQLPHGLIAVSLMTTLLPAMSAAARTGDEFTFCSRFSEGLRLLTAVMVPAAAGLALLAGPLVEGLLENGSFTGSSSSLTRDALTGLALGLPGYSLYLFALRGFYARRDTKTPFQLNLIQNSTNIALALAMVDNWGVSGLTVAYSISYSLAAAVALLTLSRRVDGLTGREDAVVAARAGLATAGMAIVVGSVVRYGADVAGPLGITFASVVAGTVTYVATGRLVGLRELDRLRVLLPGQNGG